MEKLGYELNPKNKNTEDCVATRGIELFIEKEFFSNRICSVKEDIGDGLSFRPILKGDK